MSPPFLVTNGLITTSQTIAIKLARIAGQLRKAVDKLDKERKKKTTDLHGIKPKLNGPVNSNLISQ